MDYIAAANAALAKRAQVVEQRMAIVDDKSVPMEERLKLIKPLDAQIAQYAAEADAHVRAAELEVEHRALNERGAKLSSAGAGSRYSTNGAEWRSLVPSAKEYNELRSLNEGTQSEGGFAVPTEVSTQFIDRLVNTAVFLKAPRLSVVPFHTETFTVPQLVSSTDPGIVDEGQIIPESEMTFACPQLKALKYADLRKASNELLDDSAIPMRSLVANDMIRGVAAKVDRDAFGAGDGVTALKGLTASGNSTKVQLGTGKTVVSWDDVLGAMYDIEASNAEASVVWASPSAAKALRLERTNVGGAGTGSYLAGAPNEGTRNAVDNLPMLVSTSIPEGNVIVADASRIYVGVRNEVRFRVSVDAYFNTDQVGMRLTYRIGGLVVAEPTSVQWIVPSAS